MLIISLDLPVDRAFAASASKITTKKKLSKKRAVERGGQRFTTVTLPVRLVWQVIRSQGRGALMNSSAATFSMDGSLFQIGEATWELRLKGSTIPGYYVAARHGLDGKMILHRARLLQVMGVDVSAQEQWSAGDQDSDEISHVDIPLYATSGRQMETIYRGPEEELYLVKVSAHRMN